LRKAGAARAASNGATVAQLNAIFGWSDSQMASLYTKTADRVRLAKEAIQEYRTKREYRFRPHHASPEMVYAG
ncbi:MAG TPA: hypothetical protein VFE60_05565, partial [Roseiarcus sp.]|nr:hypothetical protein [Roseiarcus sp.]